MSTSPTPQPQTPKPRLDYWRTKARDQGGTFIRWLKRSMERENLIAGFKTLLWLAPLTALIWIFAERQQVYITPEPGETIPIGVRSDDAEHVVHLRMEDNNVQAQLRGPRGRVDEVRRLIQPGIQGPSVVLTISRDASGFHEFDTDEELSKHPIFAQRGVTVTNCKPLRLPVEIDEYVQREVEVRISPQVASRVTKSTFNPPKVIVRAPGKLMREIETPVVYVELSGTELPETPGPQTIKNARLTLPQSNSDLGELVTFVPSTVEAEIEVRDRSITGEIKTVPISVVGLPSLLMDYKVECKDFLSNVPVTGPPEEVEKLVGDAALPVTARLHLVDRDKVESATITRELEIVFPPGVENVKVATPQRIDFRLVAQPR
jgi:hypothetical protein